MNTCTNSRSGAARVFSWVLAIVLVFSLAVVPTSADTYSAEVVYSSNGMDVSGKIVLDDTQLLLGIIAGMGTQGQTIMGATAYLGAQVLAVDSALIGGAYGVDLTTLAENLPRSIFAPASGSAYALEQEVYDKVMALLSGEQLQNAPAPSINVDVQAMAGSLAVLAEAYSGTIDEMMSNLIVESSDATLVINGKSMEVSQIRCTMDADSTIAAVDALIAPLQDNPQAQQALAVVIDGLAAASQQDLGATGEEVVDAIVNQLPQELEDACEELKEENFSVSAVACLSPVSLNPVKFAIEASSNTETIAINLLMSEDMDFFRIETTENGNVAAVEFAITENSEDALSWSISVQEDGREDSRISFDLNKAGKTFLVGLTANGETHFVSGFFTTTDTMFSITVDQLDGQDFGGSVTLNLRSDDSITLPSFTEITQLTESEFDALVQIVSQYAELLSQMAG